MDTHAQEDDVGEEWDPADDGQDDDDHGDLGGAELLLEVEELVHAGGAAGDSHRETTSCL